MTPDSPPRLRRRLHAQLQRLHMLVGGRYWFPHVPLALLLGLGGVLLLKADLGAQWLHHVERAVASAGVGLRPQMLPPLLIGIGMLIMALGLLARSRVAWSMALLLAITAAVSTRFGVQSQGYLLLIYFVLMLALLLFAWRHFDRSSLAGSTLFALTSVIMLVLFATFGGYYLGDQFKPQIGDLVTALYWAMVTMSTVGYGDITPQTSEAKLFTVSVIILGVAVFATSLTAVIAPLINRSLQRIVNRKGSGMKRENHFVVIGNTPLAANTRSELARRGRPVTWLLREMPEDGEPKDVDLVIGDPSNIDVLREAGVPHADSVLAMLADDSENAFVVLAVKEISETARTIAAVNDAQHLGRVKLVQPDVVIAPQVLGGELTAMLLSGEDVTPDFVMQRVFQHRDEEPTHTATPGSAT